MVGATRRARYKGQKGHNRPSIIHPYLPTLSPGIGVGAVLVSLAVSLVVCLLLRVTSVPAHQALHHGGGTEGITRTRTAGTTQKQANLGKNNFVNERYGLGNFADLRELEFQLSCRLTSAALRLCPAPCQAPSQPPTMGQLADLYFL